MSTNISELRAKILIIGDSSVGKTSILNRFTEDNFSSNMLTTIGTDYKTKRITIQNQKVKLEIWDTAGQERFRSLTQNFYKGCKGIIIVFDLTNPDSLQNVEKWITSMQEGVDNQDVIVYIVANKLDLPSKCSQEDIDKISKNSNCKNLPVSAKTGENVEKLFENLTTDIFKKFLTNERDSILDPTANPIQRFSLMNTHNKSSVKKKEQKCC